MKREYRLGTALKRANVVYMRTILSLIALFVLPFLATAKTPEDAFAAGQYSEAAGLAEKDGSADSLALAARSLLAEQVVNGTLDKVQLDKAESLARQAIAQDADHIEGRLQLAIALAMKARSMSTRAVLDSGYGKQGRELAESVIEDDPDNAYAHGFLAVWHVEVVGKGGALGSAIMGASMDDAEAHFKAAVAATPDDPALYWQYARALAASNLRRYRDEVYANLDLSLKATAKTSLEKLMQQRARAYWNYTVDHNLRESEARADALL